ncbi:MAG: DUF3047 domain-containing protein [Pseudomonadota bacterium]
MILLNLGRVWLVVVALSIGLPAVALVDESLVADGWQEVTFDGKTPNRFRTDVAGELLVESEKSVSLIQRSIDVNIARTPRLSWRWRVVRQVPPTDLATKGEDDRTLALYVAFPFVPAEASAFERMRRAVIEKFAGSEAPGRVLMYVWGGEGARGDRVISPYLGDAGIITILRPAGSETQTWQDEIVDIAEDYRQTFGSEPPDPISLAIGADSDDTQTTALGAITDLAFVGTSPTQREKGE